MTRYTNVGRKRTHLEAGFGENQVAPEDAENEAVVTDQVEQPRPAKKRKRTKQKRPKGTEDVGPKQDENAEETQPSEGQGREDVNKAVRKAYNERDETRRGAKKSEMRRLARINEKYANTTCFACREKGHAAKDCPNVKSDGPTNDRGKGNAVICYRCGSSKHTLSRCKKAENPGNPLPYASCFVCSGKGHLASSCPQNKDKGVYPNGGCCKLCGETSHLARNCPTRKQDKNGASLVVVGTGRSAGADEDDFHAFKRVNAELDVEERKEARVKRMADVKMGVVSKSVKSFATTPSAETKKKVVFF